MWILSAKCPLQSPLSHQIAFISLEPKNYYLKTWNIVIIRLVSILCRLFFSICVQDILSKKLKNVSFYICCSLIWFERLKRQKNGETGFRTLSPHNFYHISATKKDLAKPYETSSIYTAIHTFPSIMRVLCLKILNSNHCFFSIKKTNVHRNSFQRILMWLASRSYMFE